MTTQHLGLPLPGAWETLVLLALSTAAAAALLFCADAARRRLLRSLMNVRPPRPLDSSLQAMVWTLMPLSARIWLVTALRW